MNVGISTSDSGRSRTLGELIEHLGARTVGALGAIDPELPVHGTEFYDAMDELPEQPGQLLIVPSGASFDAAQLAALATRAADLRYAALALKCPADAAPTLAAIAETSGIAMLRVTERVGWRMFEALVGGLLGEQRAGDAHQDRATEPLFALANELATHFGGSVAIEDLGRRIIAYSSVPGQLIDATRTQGILARRVPDSPFNHDQYRTVLRADGPVKFDTIDDELPRIACAVRAGALPLGTIWVIDGASERAFTAGERGRLEAAAALAAAHMLDDIRVRDAGQAPREERLRTLLSGAGVTGSELAELGISEERGAALVSFDAGEGAHPTTLAQLRSTVQRHLALHRPEAVAVAWRGRVHALVAAADAATIARMIEPLLPMLDRLVGGASDSGSGNCVAIAAPGLTHRIAGVAELRERSDWLFETAAGLPGGGVAASLGAQVAGAWRASAVVDAGAAPAARRLLTVEALRPQLMLSRAAQLYEAEPTLVDPTLEELAREQPTLAAAVLAWCEAFGNVTRSAQALGVHENTIRYRLRRAEERCGLALGDPDTLLATWLQLRAAAR